MKEDEKKVFNSHFRFGFRSIHENNMYGEECQKGRGLRERREGSDLKEFENEFCFSQISSFRGSECEKVRSGPWC